LEITGKYLRKRGRSILLYRDYEPMQVVEHIQHILSDPGFGRRIAENARRKIKCFHTNEKRVQQILNWVRTGNVPDYG
jgi:spore maturation protein CgeB